MWLLEGLWYIKGVEMCVYMECNNVCVCVCVCVLCACVDVNKRSGLE